MSDKIILTLSQEKLFRVYLQIVCSLYLDLILSLDTYVI